MVESIQSLGKLIKSYREQRGLSQEHLAGTISPPVSRTSVALLEQGRRLPGGNIIKAICTYLGIPATQYEPFIAEDLQVQFDFEICLAELTGRKRSFLSLDDSSRKIVSKLVGRLFDVCDTNEQAFDTFNSLLVLYNVRPQLSWEFFLKYLKSSAFTTLEAFQNSIVSYQSDAIRIFNNFATAYDVLNTAQSLDSVLEPLKPKDTSRYTQRLDWDCIDVIESDQLRNLGYIAAREIQREKTERQAFAAFLQETARKIREDKKNALEGITDKKRKQMETFRRKFDSKLPEGFLRPLFLPDADVLEREAEALAPKDEDAIQRIANTQKRGLENLTHYLSADFLDVYVATSMRSDADFISVNSFVTKLFGHPDVRRLKLRYFNPTQSWIEDRVAKGLVEALMLRRADYTIYMAQKTDSFGKDSEASVALGQGKAVIVYVPKLETERADSEDLSSLPRVELIKIIQAEGSADDKELIDDTVDDSALLSRVLQIRLEASTDDELTETARKHWADFALYDETEKLEDVEARTKLRTWLDDIIAGKQGITLSEQLRTSLIFLLVRAAVSFEDRAKVFKQIHPLALQIIIRSGVLNGMIVVRSVVECADLLNALVHNNLKFVLDIDENNYRLLETRTRSTIRVISRNYLIGSAFATHFPQTSPE